MSIIEIIIIGISLAMDAFAVSVCKGLSIKKMTYKEAIIVAVYFGGFQGGMLFLGYALGIGFQGLIISVDHWIVFALLVIIGGKMIAEAYENYENTIDEKIDFKTMSVLAIATSIDALAVGITIACLNVNIIISALIVALITFVLCYFGVQLGNKFENKFGKKAELVGGIILIFIGTKILLEHLQILNF